MPVHDWTRVEAGIFHDFHSAWITELRNTLNGGLLTSGYYALTEQHAGRYVADLLTLHASSPDSGPLPQTTSSGLALAVSPPKVRHQLTALDAYRQRRRTLAIRHVSGHRLFAVVEIASPVNKDRSTSVEVFVGKAVGLLELGIHVMLVDLIPPGPHDSHGLHGAIWAELDETPYDPPSAEPLTVASYAAGSPPRAFVDHFAIGTALPEMPLFLTSDRYVPLPLETTYTAAYHGVPAFWREVIEGRGQPANG